LAQKIKHIAIIGDDLHAWTVATRLLPSLIGQDLKITVIGEAPESRPSVIALDVSAHQFHRKLGIQEPQLVADVGGAYCYGVRYKSNVSDKTDFVYAYSPAGQMLDRVEFHNYLARLKLLGGSVNLADYSIAALAAKNNTFTHPQPGTVLDKLDYMMQVDGLRYLHLLRSSAIEHGVEHRQYNVVDALRNANTGQLEKLNLSDGSNVECDFVFDCVGGFSEAGDYDDCADALGINKSLSWVKESVADTPVLGLCETFDNAHCRTAYLPGGESSAFFYSGDNLPNAFDFVCEKYGRLAAETATLSDCPSRIHRQAWRSNMLTLGDAAGSLGGVVFGGLYHTHAAIERWLILYPEAQVNPLLAKEYNRQMRVEYDHVRDVHSLLLRTEQSKIPETLAHRIDVFRKTARVAFYEGDVLEKHQWVNLFIGCGIWPERADPLLNHIPKRELQALLTALAKQTKAVVDKFPAHDQLLKAIRQSV